MVHETEPPPEPAITLSSPGELLAGYLDFYRDAVLRKLDGLSEQELRSSRLPSGWTPLGLLKHLAHVELRWLRWGFLGADIAEPWADRAVAGQGWPVAAEESPADLRSFFREQCARSREIVANARLSDRAAIGGRFATDEERPTLIWILFHLLQEYARHVGQLDVVRELADGEIGE